LVTDFGGWKRGRGQLLKTLDTFWETKDKVLSESSAIRRLNTSKSVVEESRKRDMFVLHRRSPLQHETTLSNSKTSRASARSVPLCLAAEHLRGSQLLDAQYLVLRSAAQSRRTSTPLLHN
jgi:hypothetical protein